MIVGDGSEAVYCAESIQVLREPELAAAGWDRRTVTDPTRIGELEDLYSSLGFETCTTEMDPSSFGDACNTCAVTACSTYLALFTRKQATG
jgi:hypothetical protein